MFTQRALSAVLIVTLTALFVYLGGVLFALFVAAVAAIAARELCIMLDERGLAPLMSVTMIGTLAFVFDAYFLQQQLTTPIVLLLSLLPLPLLIFREPDYWRALKHWALAPIGAIYIGLPLGYFVLLRGISAETGFGGLSQGVWWVTLAILCTWASDTGAYITGMLLGRHKFAQHISPHKTWEGTIGGILWSVIVGAAMGVWILPIGLVHGAVLGIAVGLAAVIGDLGESLIKRGAGVKDTGHLLPGHGGMLDRLDSLIFTGPLTYYYYTQVILRWQ